MLKTRVIPVLTIKDLRLVKSVQFAEHRNIGSFIAAARVFNARDVDEMVVLDLDGRKSGLKPELLKEITKECFMPLTVGGGVRSVEDVQKLLSLGADKVSLNTEAVRNPKLISEASKRFGSQCVVVSIDAKKTANGYEVMIDGGRDQTGLSPVVWAKEAQKMGAGEILLTSIDHDGCMDGYDVELVREVSLVVSLPVIACGGAGNASHCVEVVQKGGASAVSAASMFQYTEITPRGIKEELAKAGIEVRL
ncbi:MAG: glycosyl amidation-associated protein WbuZ [bacterium]|nr:glycosyl amidation-associated protein WbuZ [bacterium]